MQGVSYSAVEWPIRHPAAAWIRLFCFSLIGIAPAAVTITALIGIDVGELTGLAHDFDIVVVVAAGLVLVTSIALPLICLKMRSPEAMRVTLDRWGMTEWEGGSVRTAIPWERASVFALETRVRQRHGGVYQGGMTVSVKSDSGSAINVAWGRWSRHALRKRMVSSVDFPAAALTQAIPGSTRRMGEIVWDPRDERRGLFFFARIVGLLFLAVVGGGIAQISNDLGTNGRDLAGLLFLVGSFLALLRGLRPLVENVRLSREDAPHRGARPYQVTPLEWPFARAVDATGQQHTLDLSAVVHPDAMVFQRGGSVFLTVDAAGAAGAAYRAAPGRAIAVETERDRRERRRIKRANRIEITARALLAFGLFAVTVLLWADLQVH